MHVPIGERLFVTGNAPVIILAVTIILLAIIAQLPPPTVTAVTGGLGTVHPTTPVFPTIVKVARIDADIPVPNISLGTHTAFVPGVPLITLTIVVPNGIHGDHTVIPTGIRILSAPGNTIVTSFFVTRYTLGAKLSGIPLKTIAIGLPFLIQQLNPVATAHIRIRVHSAILHALLNPIRHTLQSLHMEARSTFPALLTRITFLADTNRLAVFV
jgi:hypothetical protein